MNTIPKESKNVVNLYSGVTQPNKIQTYLNNHTTIIIKEKNKVLYE